MQYPKVGRDYAGTQAGSRWRYIGGLTPYGTHPKQTSIARCELAPLSPPAGSNDGCDAISAIPPQGRLRWKAYRPARVTTCSVVFFIAGVIGQVLRRKS